MCPDETDYLQSHVDNLNEEITKLKQDNEKQKANLLQQNKIIENLLKKLEKKHKEIAALTSQQISTPLRNKKSVRFHEENSEIKMNNVQCQVHPSELNIVDMKSFKKIPIETSEASQYKEIVLRQGTLDDTMDDVNDENSLKQKVNCDEDLHVIHSFISDVLQSVEQVKEMKQSQLGQLSVQSINCQSLEYSFRNISSNENSFSSLPSAAATPSHKNKLISPRRKLLERNLGTSFTSNSSNCSLNLTNMDDQRRTLVEEILDKVVRLRHSLEECEMIQMDISTEIINSSHLSIGNTGGGGVITGQGAFDESMLRCQIREEIQSEWEKRLEEVRSTTSQYWMARMTEEINHEKELLSVEMEKRIADVEKAILHQVDQQQQEEEEKGKKSVENYRMNLQQVILPLAERLMQDNNCEWENITNLDFMKHLVEHCNEELVALEEWKQNIGELLNTFCQWATCESQQQTIVQRISSLENQIQNENNENVSPVEVTKMATTWSDFVNNSQQISNCHWLMQQAEEALNTVQSHCENLQATEEKVLQNYLLNENCKVLVKEGILIVEHGNDQQLVDGYDDLMEAYSTLNGKFIDLQHSFQQQCETLHRVMEEKASAEEEIGNLQQELNAIICGQSLQLQGASLERNSLLQSLNEELLKMENGSLLNKCDAETLINQCETGTVRQGEEVGDLLLTINNLKEQIGNMPKDRVENGEQFKDKIRELDSQLQKEKLKSNRLYSMHKDTNDKLRFTMTELDKLAKEIEQKNCDIQRLSNQLAKYKHVATAVGSSCELKRGETSSLLNHRENSLCGSSKISLCNQPDENSTVCEGNWSEISRMIDEMLLCVVKMQDSSSICYDKEEGRRGLNKLTHLINQLRESCFNVYNNKVLSTSRENEQLKAKADRYKERYAELARQAKYYQEQWDRNMTASLANTEQKLLEARKELERARNN